MFKRILIILSSLIVFFIVLELIIRVFVFFYFTSIELKNKNMVKDGKEVRILCIGESTTAGMGKNAYPDMLEEILKLKGYKVKVINKGVHKTNTNFILEKIPEYIRKCNPQIMVSMMGINDDGVYYRGIQEKDSFFFTHIKSYQYLRNLFNILSQQIKGQSVIRKKYLVYLNKAKLEAKKGNYSLAEKYCKKSVELNEKNILTYIFLSQMYFDMGDYNKFQSLAKKMVSLFYKEYSVYMHIGGVFQLFGDYQNAAKFLAKAHELNQDNKDMDLMLADIYYNLGMVDVAEKIYLELAALNSDKAIVYIRLGFIYKDKKDEENSKKFLQQAEKLSLDQEKIGVRNLLYNKYCNEVIHSVTKSNYKELYSVLNKLGITLVVVQYPRRNVKLLEEIFEKKDKLFFVDNKAIFDMAVESEGYSKIFIDVFAGDFGHCTVRGNTLLAENIANIIAKEILNKK